ncbi:MAG TPA: polysaccharide deacetylase family protein [Candidatus Dormibacteraeota bacterium]|nr:polysaccharide deacetylase family protein [Candidatus Dormibacteraeota bacterium]
MAKTQKHIPWSKYLNKLRRWHRLHLLYGLLALAAVIGLISLAAPGRELNEQTISRDPLRIEFGRLSRELDEFKRTKRKYNARYIVTNRYIDEKITDIQININSGERQLADRQIKDTRRQLAVWQEQLAREVALKHPVNNSSLHEAVIPILMYHHTPTDFEQQLLTLRQKGYTTITPDRLAAALKAGLPLPGKPAIITFDDGFADQVVAFELLKKYQMSATFYIVNGGEGSQWCIGSGRRYNDPAQPSGGCGDAYLNWNQVRELDKSGLITIGAHTIDHANLAGLSAEQQRAQINGSKAGIELELGHPIYHFAYPYGSFTGETIQIVKEAGFITAVSTIPGSVHARDTLHTLYRVRDAYSLP